MNKIIYNTNLPFGIISLITSLFTKCTTRILVNQKFTNEIELQRGLLQGSILSPLLFNIFIDDLAQEITQLYPNDPLPHCLFYADDIKLNHNDKEEIQKMLNICSAWAKRNNMKFNIEKSAYLKNEKSPLDTTLNLYLKINGENQRLKGEVCYKYLGFPHKLNGIDWKFHLEENAKKSLNTLNSLQFYHDVLPTYIKLHIFRIYIRPMMEYSAPLIFYNLNEKVLSFLTSDKNQSKKIDYSDIKTYHEVTKKGLNWIVEHKKSNSATALLGIPTTIVRLYCLAIKLQHHMKKMDKSNPLYIAFNPPPGVAALDSVMYSMTGKYYKWRELFTTFSYFGPTSMTYEEQVNHPDKRINEILFYFINKNKMGKVILPIARVNNNEMDTVDKMGLITSTDKCVFIRNSFVRNMAVSWRVNSFLFGSSCPICGNEFRRSHINLCDFIHQPPYNKIIKEKYLSLFIEDKLKYKEILPKTYNILDSLLNHHNYYTFSRMIEKMMENSFKIIRNN